MTGEGEPEFTHSLSRALSLEFTPREPKYSAYPRILSTSHADSTQTSSEIGTANGHESLRYIYFCMKFKWVSLKQVRDDDEGKMKVRYVPVTATSVTSTFHVPQVQLP